MEQQPVLTTQQVTKADRINLIRMVRERPMIWDSNITKGKDQLQMDWYNISQSLSSPGRNFDVALVKKIWTYLRDKYMQTMKAGKAETSTWQYLESLFFLKNEFDAKQEAKFVISVTDGLVIKQVTTNINQRCDHFYRSVRGVFEIDESKPFKISTSSNKNIPNSSLCNVADFGIVDEKLLQIIVGVSSRIPGLRNTLTFSSVEEAKKYRKVRDFDIDLIFSVYLIVRRVNQLQAAALNIDSDFFRLAIKCGTSQRTDIKKRFYDQGFNDTEHRQVLIASCNNEKARSLGFSSSETWAYGLELAFGELSNLFAKTWKGGTQGCALNMLCQQEAAGKFSFEWCYETLLKFIKKSVQEDVAKEKFSKACAELRLQFGQICERLSKLMHRLN